jgi:predicted  nucleic acid-binding Zn-ribbon protein
MRTIRLLAAVMLAGMAAASAQDVAGVEDCTKTSGLDRRTGCLQANVNFLQRTMTRNALEADRRLKAAEGEITTLKSELAALRKQLDALQSAKAAAEKKAEGKKAEEKKTDGKK